MTTFLEKIASIYLAHHVNDLQEMIFVFPNRRAGLFFRHYLTQQIQQPIFAPQTIPISDLFSELSSLQTLDRLGLLFLLYSLYNQISGKKESFDHFAYWGEMLINDFDDVDKYLIDARQLFFNVKELKEIDTRFDYLSPNQIEAIKRFWSTFEPSNESSKQKDFRVTWELLYPLYEAFKKALSHQQEGYQGMIFRDVAEKINNGIALSISAKRFVFVGFNALTPAEKVLFRHLKAQNIADFYWDDNISELQDPVNRGSAFIHENRLEFPSLYEPEKDLHVERTISLIKIPSAVGQAKYTAHLLRKLSSEKPASATADEWIKTVVLLADEQLLMPVIHSLPETIRRVNITMGYPVSISSAALFVNQLIQLQRNVKKKDQEVMFYHRQVQELLHHSYILYLMPDEAKQLTHNITLYNKVFVPKEDLTINELFSAIFVPCETATEILSYLVSVISLLLQQLQAVNEEDTTHQIGQELLFSLYKMLNRANALFKKYPVEMEPDTLHRLIKQLMDGLILPFEGEPLSGLQLMGLLETRSLDFERVIILSFNEGVFPKKQATQSFIPYNLRKGFGLPTGEHQDAVYAYHFYRLLHRAKEVHLLYDTRSNGIQSGEVSRYVYQLRYHYQIPLEEISASFPVIFNNSVPIEVKKTASVAAKLQPFLQPDSNKALSASAINQYLDCPLRFYLTTIEALKEETEVDESIEANTFGSLFHEAIQRIYQPLIGKSLSEQLLDELKQTDHLDEVIALVYTRTYLKKENGLIIPEGQHAILMNVIRQYLIQLINWDKKQVPFTLIGTEKQFRLSFPIRKGTQQVNLKGIIDRMDQKDKQVRIFDYKTGKEELSFNAVEQLFHVDPGKKRAKAVFQLFFYSLLYANHQSNDHIEPGIILLQNIFKPDFNTQILFKNGTKKEPMVDFSTWKQPFTDQLTALLEEIFDPDIPFRQTDDPKHCTYCPFINLCKRAPDIIDNENENT
ncbi:MAG: PD-(D/E)XK nuclease family protein [Microbacter sp.]